MAPPPPREEEDVSPVHDDERDADRAQVANGRGREELDESLDAEVRNLEDMERIGAGEDDNDDDDFYDEDINAAERVVEDFGGFDPPLYIQRFVLQSPFLLGISIKVFYVLEV